MNGMSNEILSLGQDQLDVSIDKYPKISLTCKKA